MSQLETIMMVLLGFAVASLLALFLGRAAWKIAYCLGARRTRKQIPGSMMELQAERDQLRAECAMVKRRTEVEIEAAKARGVEQTAEVMRNRNRIGVLAQELDNRGRLLAERDAELAALRGQLAMVESELVRRTEAIASLETRLAGQEASTTASTMPVVEPPPLPRPVSESILRLETFRPQPGPATTPEPDLAAAQDRLSRRIRELTKPAGLQDHPAHRLPEVRPSPLAPKTLSTTEALPALPPGNGLDRLVHSSPAPDDLAGAPGAEAPPPARAISPSVANVISLAQRLRALRKDAGN